MTEHRTSVRELRGKFETWGYGTVERLWEAHCGACSWKRSHIDPQEAGLFADAHAVENAGAAVSDHDRRLAARYLRGDCENRPGKWGEETYHDQARERIRLVAWTHVKKLPLAPPPEDSKQAEQNRKRREQRQTKRGNKLCLYCLTEFTPKRADQKFCRPSHKQLNHLKSKRIAAQKLLTG